MNLNNWDIACGAALFTLFLRGWQRKLNQERQKDYILLKELWQEDLPAPIYLAISRRLILVSSFEDGENIDKLMEFSYHGTFSEFMFDRFNVEIDEKDEHADTVVGMPKDKKLIKQWVLPYHSQIINQIEKEKESYLSYIKQFSINEKDAVIDLWYDGTNQFHLSQIVQKKLTGFYFAANLSDENENLENNVFIPCFQTPDDVRAEDCNLKKGELFTESFLTAPYGMIKAVDDKFCYECAAGGSNQTYFAERESMNEGVCKFMEDYFALMGKGALLDTQFIDGYFGEYVRGHMELADDLKHAFYFDNAIAHRRESRIFE